MTNLTFNDPCVLFAMHREARPFLREFRPQQRFPGAPCRARFCGPAWLTVLTVETGIGPHRTERALEWLFSGPALGGVAYRPKLVLSAGFAGALRDDLRVGDVVLATEVADPGGHRWPTTWPGDLPPGEWHPPLHRGRLLGGSKLVAVPEEKRALGQTNAALAVDMESATVARLCTRAGVPFGCVRAISDETATALSPRLVSLLSAGRVSPLGTAGAVIRQPGLVPQLWRLARHTRLAAGQLGIAIGELLTLTLPWMAEA